MQLTEISALAATVNVGVARLDERCPGWRDRVDIDMIEAGCNIHSVTGQLFGPEVADQMSGVGIDWQAMSGGDACQMFAGHGYAVLGAVEVAVPAVVLEAAKSHGVDLPTSMPLPRNPDVCLMEAEALTLLWQREVSRR